MFLLQSMTYVNKGLNIKYSIMPYFFNTADKGANRG